MYKIIVSREKVTTIKDSKGELSTIGTLKIFDKDNNQVFKCLTCENGSKSSDESGKDYRIMPRDYYLQWNYTSTSTAKNGYRNVYFEKTNHVVSSVYHDRFKKWNFKNLGLQICNDNVAGFNVRWIFIHIGNSGKDTEGCLLLGYEKTSQGILQSTQAIQDFYDFIKEKGIIEDGIITNFTLTIQDNM